MGKPTSEEVASASAADQPVAAVPGGAEAMVIRAEPGKPWPEPPSSGRWVRNAKTGDLTCMELPAQLPTEEERRARREKQREAALKAATTTNAKE